MTESIQITTHSPDETRKLGEIIGKNIHGKLTIALSGDLAAGKTVFVQGLARGLAVPADYYITSPTYTLINEYPGRLKLFHADLYRIAGGNTGKIFHASELIDIGFEECEASDGVLVVEWADRLPPGELCEDLLVLITAVGELTRNFSLFFYGRKNSNLIKLLKKTFETDTR